MTAPTEKQIRMMHVVNLISIAYSDGTIADKEANLIREIAQRWELSEDEFNECVEYWKNKDEVEIPIAVPNDEDEEIEFLKDFTWLMMIDGTLEDGEKVYLSRVANEFGYDADKVVPQLIDIVYDEHFADSDDEEDEDEDNEEEEDELFEDTYDESQINMGKIELQGKQLEKAFDELFLPALRNAEAYACFHSIPGIDTRLFRITQEQLDLIQKAADKGYAVAHYVLGRYHQVVKPEEESIEKALKYLESAAKAGIPDAQWALAIDYLYGYQGPVELDEFNKRIDQAIDNGSMLALKQRLYDTIHGLHGQKADPKTIIRQIEAFLAKDEENALIYPYMYDLLGDAYRKIGNKDKADESYEKAVDNGFFEADAHRFENRVDGPDKDFYRQTFSFLLDFSCDNKAPRSFMLRGLESAFTYEQDEEEDEDLTEKIKADLETAYELGEGDAAYYLGQYYYEGSHGFEKDDDEAWDWFYKGGTLESGLAFKGMIKMIEDGYELEGMPEDYLETLRLHASYRLNEAEAETAIPTMIIVNAKGEATIYKVEKTEWYKLRHITGARRIFPIRLEVLDKLGQKAGLTDHLVAWTDIDGPRKGLPENKVIAKQYKGVVAGDVVFSLAGKLYDPMPFYGVEEAEAVIKALGAKLTEVVTDISEYSDERNEPIDINMVNPFVRKGYIARIEKDGKAHLLNSSLDVFAMFEDDIYDPARLPKLYDLGKSVGLKDRLTVWTDNSALGKQLNWKDEIDQNPIGAQWCPFLVADNIFVALEDENYRMKLFDDLEQLKQVCIALGVPPEHLIVEKI